MLTIFITFFSEKKKKNKMYADEFYIVILSETHMVECCETHEKWNETRNEEMNKTTNEQQHHQAATTPHTVYSIHTKRQPL